MTSILSTQEALLSIPLTRLTSNKGIVINPILSPQPEFVGLKADVWIGHVLGACECFPSQGFSLRKIIQSKENKNVR